MERGKDFETLRRAAAPQLRTHVARAGASLSSTGQTTWTFGEIPATYTAGAAHGIPALIDEGTTVGMRVLPTSEEAQAEHRLGVRRLVLLNVTPPWRQILAKLTNAEKLALAHNPHGSVPELLADALAAAVDAIIGDGFARVRTDADQRIQASLQAMTNPALRALRADVSAQRRELIRPGFVAETGLARLPDLERYLAAIIERLEKAPLNLAQDAARQEQVDVVEARYAELLDSLRPEQRSTPSVEAIGWMIEELRVSLFAQRLGTQGKVSVQRIAKAIAAIDA